MNDQLLYKMIA